MRRIPGLEFLKIMPIWVAVMTGILSLAREILTLYPPTDIPFWNVKLFWSCVWIAFVISVIAAWIIKDRELRAERAKQIYPDFQGKIEEFFLEESKTRKHLTVSKITLIVRLVNRGTASSIESYQLAVIADGKTYATKNIPTKDVLFERAPYDEYGLPVTDEGAARPYENLEITKHVRRERGEIFKGWLRYALIESFLRREMDCELELTVIDAFGKPHFIRQKPSWSKNAKALTIIELNRNS